MWAYRHHRHSRGVVAGLGPSVKVLLDLSCHWQLVLVFWQTIILKQPLKWSQSVTTVMKLEDLLILLILCQSYNLAIKIRTQYIVMDSGWITHSDPGMFQHLQCCVSLIHFHLQHRHYQLLRRQTGQRELMPNPNVNHDLELVNTMTYSKQKVKTKYYW